MTDGASGEHPPRILYIAGAQHCGSTMLDAILGNAPGALSLGEVGGFHRYQAGAMCDCGEKPATCGPCRAVISSLVAHDVLDEYHRMSPLPLKERRLHWTMVGTKARRAYGRVAGEVFDAVASETGSSILVDSSKNISRAAALVHDSGHDVRIVHLVRDGRGYLRSRARRAEGGRGAPLPVALVPWLAKNLLLWVVLRRRVPRDRYLLCRYEDLVRDPAAELGRIGTFADLDVDSIAADAVGEGLVRHHLFEPRRRVDYHRVRLDPSRLQAPGSPRGDLYYWLFGGFVSARWGYRRRGQADLPRATSPAP